MSILFVLLTFLVIIFIQYFRRSNPAAELQPTAAARKRVPAVARYAGMSLPKDYCFHPGHTWAVDEGRQTARVGIDELVASLVGKIDAIEVTNLNRWVRQGQKFCTVIRDGKRIELLSPIEGVVASVNHEIVKNPNLIVDDPYGNGWVCSVKAPDLAMNLKNLLQASLVSSWMQNTMARISAMVSTASPALAQDGGFPVKGLLFQVEPDVQAALIKELFLTL